MTYFCDLAFVKYGVTDAHEELAKCFRKDVPSAFWKVAKYRGDVVSCEEQPQEFVANRFAKGPENFACSREFWERCLEEWENNKQDDVWLERQVAEAKVRHEHAKQLRNWWRGRVKEHKLGLAVKRKARADAIFQRLAELGWKEELDLQRDRDGLSCLEKFRIGTQAKKLSEKDWNDLRPKLEAALQEAKAGRLQSELCTKWTKRYSQFVRLLKAELDKLPFNTVGPGMSDYANLPPFQKKLFLPIEHELVEDDLSDLFGQMPQIREEWIQARKEDLVGVLKKNGMADATLETLNSAATIFACGTCGARCVYPRPLMHKCLRGLENSSHRGIARGEPSFDDFLLFANGMVWQANMFSLSKRSRKAQDILSIVGLPVNATVEDVTKRN
ncbi:hypothetical protein V5O48_015988, partial [Marasmius crinis-equi]